MRQGSQRNRACLIGRATLITKSEVGIMLNKIINALHARKDISAWTVRHITSREVQVYAVPKNIESQRSVGSESYKVDVLSNTTAADGSPAIGRLRPRARRGGARRSWISRNARGVRSRNARGVRSRNIQHQESRIQDHVIFSPTFIKTP